MSTSGSPVGTQSVDRAAALVDLVVRADEPITFTALSDEAGLARSTTSRLLAALERTDLVERDPSGGYVAGPLFALHAALHDPGHQLARLVHPVLVEIGKQTGETVHLGVPRGDNVVHIAQVDSTYLLSARDWNQVEVPAHCSSLGKVLLAHGLLTPAPVLLRPTDNTAFSRARLDSELARIREVGHARTVDELEIGLTGAAAPISAREGVIAAIGVSGPTSRLLPRLDALGELLSEHAERLSTQLRRPSRTDGSTQQSDQEGAA